MALAHRAAPRLTLSELIAEATDFCRDAWRDCWLVMMLLVGVQTYMFARGHIAPADWHKSPFDFLVPILTLLYVPLYGALYRTALGGRPLQGLGLGGLQWKGVEWRLIAVGFVIVFLIGLATVPFMLVNFIAALLMGLHTQMSFGPFGGWARWTPAAVVIWLVFFALTAPRIARLMLGWAYSSAREKIEPFAGWEPGKASGWSIAIALVLAGAPMLLGWLAVYALTLVEPDALGGEYWPVPETLGVGLLLGILKVAVVAPLSVGVLTGAWWLLEGDAEATAPARPTTTPSSTMIVPPRHDHRGFIDSLGPAAVAAMAAAAATIAIREAAELGLHHKQVDRNSEPPEPEGSTVAEHPEHAAESHVADSLVDEPAAHAAEAVVPTAIAHETPAPFAEPQAEVVHEEAKSGAVDLVAAPLAAVPLVAESAKAESVAAPELAPVVAAAVEPPEPEVAPEPSPESWIVQPAAQPVAEVAEVSAKPATTPFTVAPARPEPAHFAALSDWPHTVLPPWTPLAQDSSSAAAPLTLASEPEPDHSKGVSEPD